MGFVDTSLQAMILLVTIGVCASLHPHAPDGDDVYILAVIAAICAFRRLTPILLWGPIFDWWNPEQPNEDVRKVVRSKFGNHMNKFMLHSAFQVWGYQVLMSESWFNGWFDMDACWKGWDPVAPQKSGNFRDFYLAQLAFFLASVIMQFFEVRSHDHTAMLAHHSGAAILVILSYLFNTTHIGMLVLVTREITDVMIHFIRAAAILEFKTLSELTLVLLMIVWAITRNYYHTFVVCLGAWNSATYEWNYNMWVVYNLLLALLVPLDFYYLYLGLDAIARRLINPSQKSIDPDVNKERSKVETKKDQ
eukprot:TRINITY_DN20430_c0_g2_i1.p1 TRINITY_DN20430_c0_g2~~TRINITY_DN20430_c0_g2_i1.p1  ORF type:complete len:324 (+),score=138.18 TRINITY_DN20430_c0_g2_i1:55-972(+)